MVDGKRFDTIAVHGAYVPDNLHSAVVTPIHLSTTFKQTAPGEHKAIRPEIFLKRVLHYSKMPNMVVFVLTSEGLAFSSGLAAIGTIVSLLSSGSHVISVNDVYGGSNRYFRKVASKNGIHTDFVDVFDPENIKKYLRENTQIIWIESPTNPTLTLVDIKAISKIAHEYNKEIIVVVDNTFLSPYFQNPLDLGADIVMHSATKYINGHCDVLMGLCMTNNPELHERIKYFQNAIGGVPSGFDCYLVLRSLKTLHVRMQRHAENALAIAEYLEKQKDKILKVSYPGLKSHPQHELAVRQQKGFGGMIAIVLKGDIITTRRFLDGLKLFTLAESLGGVESLIEVPSIMTHSGLSTEERKDLGIVDTFVRVSVGIEDVNDLIADLKNGLEHAFKE